MVEKQVPQIFSQARRKARWQRAVSSADGAARFVEMDMSEEVLERIDFMRFPSGKALITGSLTVELAIELDKRGFETTQVSPHEIDEEKPLTIGTFDLIVSLGSLDTLNDLPGALIHLRNALSDDGLFIGQMVGAGSLPSLRQVMLTADGDQPAARLHPQVDNRAATGLLERAGFKRQVVDSRTIRASYRSFDRLIGDLREQAMNSVLLTKSPAVGKAGLARANAAFEALKDEEGRVTEAFEILTLTGWR